MSEARMYNQSSPEAVLAAMQKANSPEQMQQWLRLAESLGPLGDEERDIDRQQKYADALRDTDEFPEGRHAGRTFVAADPLEGVAGLAKQYVGQEMGRRLGDRRKGVSDEIKWAIRNELNPRVQEMVPGQFAIDAYG